MSDERRAEIEAVAAVLRAIINSYCPQWDRRIDWSEPSYVEQSEVDAEHVLAALDRLRDARGDDEAGRCPTCGLHYDEDSAGAECSRLEADIFEIHDALADPDEPSAINAAWIIERIETLKADAARSPQGEDHEAGIEDDARAYHRVCDALWPWWSQQESMTAEEAVRQLVARVSAPKADEKQEAR